MADENARDAADAAKDEPSPLGKIGETIATHAANIAQGIPGMEAAEASVRSLVRRQPYREALSDIRAATGQIPTAVRVGERVGGAIPLTALLPSNPAIAGALLGGADQALDADPMSAGARAGRTALGAAGGAVLGRTGEKLVTAGKALLPKALGGTLTPEANILSRQAARAKSAKVLYDAAAQEGRQREATQAVQAFLQEPEIATRIQALQQLEGFKGVAPDDPKMINALYQSLSDEAKQIGKGLAAVDPSKPNTGRFRGENVSKLKDRLLTALETPGTKEIPAQTFETNITTAQSPHPTLREALANFEEQKAAVARRSAGTVAQQKAREGLERHAAESSVGRLAGAPGPRSVTIPATQVETPPMMPSYRQAVEDYAQHSAGIQNVGRGMTALQRATKPSRPTFRQILKNDATTPMTLAEWAKGATPQQLQAVREGVYGDLKNAFKEPGKTFAPGRRAATEASTLLRQLDPSSTEHILQLLGIANAPLANP